MDEEESPGLMLLEEQARRRAERHELEEQARRRREHHLSWPRSLTLERRREHNIMPSLEEHSVPAFAVQRDISRARLRHQQASLLEHRHRLLSIDEHVQDIRRMRDRSRRFPPPRGGDRQSRLEIFRALVQQAAAENADGPRERALRALADAASAIGPNSTEARTAAASILPATNPLATRLPGAARRCPSNPTS
tara:strand:- start:532 stop:1113 length:582 start_codon:yes stop_codon:yes gene_type:complete|eukprot:scaffold20446_cov54-Phaeocystis_antarctica.AAC.1